MSTRVVGGGADSSKTVIGTLETQTRKRVPLAGAPSVGGAVEPTSSGALPSPDMGKDLESQPSTSRLLEGEQKSGDLDRRPSSVARRGGGGQQVRVFSMVDNAPFPHASAGAAEYSVWVTTRLSVHHRSRANVPCFTSQPRCRREKRFHAFFVLSFRHFQH